MLLVLNNFIKNSVNDTRQISLIQYLRIRKW